MSEIAHPKFLESVADYFMRKTVNHSDTLLVFPNKRAIIYMRQYLKKHIDKFAILPKMRTIGAFFGELCPLAEASRIEQIFTLFDAYCEITARYGRTPAPFERFRFWGEIMLDDFDDIDRQLASARDVFLNVKNIEEIRVYFLEEEHRAVSRELFGYDPESFEGFKSSKRRREGVDNDLVYDEYVKLTEMLLPIYERFCEMLESRGITTRGRIARHAASAIEALADDGAIDDMLPRKIAFVGFGVLPGADRRVFRTLRKLGRADFFWNVPSMLTRDLPDEMSGYRSPLAKYIAKLTDYFTMPDDFTPPALTPMPTVKIIGVPASTLQAKVAGNILDTLDKNDELSPGRPDNTIIVVPDTSLLVPLLHGIGVSPVNVTMGLPLRDTPFATLLSLIIRLNLSARRNSSGRIDYLTRDVVRILSHPSLSAIFPLQTARLRSQIERERRFTTTLEFIRKNAPDIAFVFDPMSDKNTADEALTYLTALIDGLLALIERGENARESKADKSNSSTAGDGKPDGAKHVELHERRVLMSMRNAIEALVDVIKNHEQYLDLGAISKLSFFRLIEKQLFHEQLNLSGSPLSGIQIAGPLETRDLDFDNVIMLSMNEKIFPPKNFMRSLIPAALRDVYGLSTSEFRELEYAWIYAGLMSRCKNAFLVFNSAAQSLKGGGMSRYLFQTEFIYNRPKPLKIDLAPDGHVEGSSQIVVRKTPDIMRQLDEFKAGGSRNLSVTILEKYAACPLAFYLGVVCRIKEPKTTEANIDDLIIGDTVHKVMEHLYNSGKISGNPAKIAPSEIKQLVTKQLLLQWAGTDATDYQNLPHEARMQIDLWTRKVLEIIRLERARMSDYSLFCCEMSPENIIGSHTFDWQITPDRNIRFTFFIDRVDRLNDGSLRFVDYKTGRDQLEVKDMENLFWRTPDPAVEPVDNKAMFQLLTYAEAYSDLMQSLGQPLGAGISLEITRVVDPANSIGMKLKIGGTEIDNHRSEAVKDFRANLNQLVESIFDPDKPFCQTPFDKYCHFCQFKNICHR